MSKPGHVDTPYGPMPGCRDCGVILLHGGPHICEHGVTVAPSLERAFTVVVDTEDYKGFMDFIYGDAIRSTRDERE